MKTPEQIHGHMTSSELDWLAEKASQANVIIELGCYKGRSTKQLALSSQGIIYTIDNFIGIPGDNELSIREEFEDNLRLELGSGKVILIPLSRQDAIEELYTLDIKADLIFIDAAHDYESVRDDIKSLLPFVKKDGIICGHDYRLCYDGLRQAVDEAFPTAIKEMGEEFSIWSYKIK